MDNQSKVNHWCIVPMCKSTSKRTPDKTFIQVPKNEERRKLWLELVRREPKEFSKTSNVFICEDHFDLENDMENYLRWKLMGGQKIMKPDAKPHKFDCQTEKELTFEQSILRIALEKKKRSQEIEDAAKSSSTTLILENLSSKLDEAVNQLPEFESLEKRLEYEAVDQRLEHAAVQQPQQCAAVIIREQNYPKNEDSSAADFSSSDFQLTTLVKTDIDENPEYADESRELYYPPISIDHTQIKAELSSDDYTVPCKRRRLLHDGEINDEKESDPEPCDVRDEFFYFGKNVACQLRQLPLDKALLCQSKILGLLMTHRVESLHSV